MISTWLITSKLANKRAQKVLFTCVVYANIINMLDLLLMPQVKLPLVDRIYPQSNRFVVDVETKPIVTQNLMTAPNRTLSCNKILPVLPLIQCEAGQAKTKHFVLLGLKMAAV